MKHTPAPGRFETMGDWEPPGFPRRIVTAYVPADHVPDGTRPALFLFDGQNVFDDAFSYAGGWYAHEAVEALPRETCNVPVVVGISHGGERRVDELVPWKMAKGGGHLASFLAWVVFKVVPEAQAAYGTVPGPLGAVLGGSSLGGLVSLYLGLRLPHVFGKIAALSPSVWWNERVILRFATAAPVQPIPRIWLDVGTREGGHTVEDVERFRDILLRKGWELERDLHFERIEGAEHNEAAWSRRVGPFLQFLFPATESRV